MEISQGSPWTGRNHWEKETARVKWISIAAVCILWGYCVYVSQEGLQDLVAV